MCRKIVYGRYRHEGGQWIWQDDGTLNNLQKEVENLRGHIRRLEKANEQLGLENHKLKGRGQGWNQNV